MEDFDLPFGLELVDPGQFERRVCEREYVPLDHLKRIADQAKPGTLEWKYKEYFYELAEAMRPKIEQREYIPPGTNYGGFIVPFPGVELTLEEHLNPDDYDFVSTHLYITLGERVKRYYGSINLLMNLGNLIMIWGSPFLRESEDRHERNRLFWLDISNGEIKEAPRIPQLEDARIKESKFRDITVDYSCEVPTIVVVCEVDGKNKIGRLAPSLDEDNNFRLDLVAVKNIPKLDLFSLVKISQEGWIFLSSRENLYVFSPDLNLYKLLPGWKFYRSEEEDVYLKDSKKQIYRVV